MPLDFKGLALVAFGSVASTVLLTGTAQAQMAANANYGATLGGVNFDGNLGGITEFNFDGMMGLVDAVPLDYTPAGPPPPAPPAPTLPNDFNAATMNGITGDEFTPFLTTVTNNIATIDFSTLVLGDPNFVPFALPGFLNWGGNTTPSNRYSFSGQVARLTSQTNSGLNIQILGQFVDSNGDFLSGDASVSLSMSSSGPNAGSANYTFGIPPAFIPPPSQSTPEPGTIIGLVAVGAGALVSRRRKDSK
ncbi:PEP-CTERM sorting domain-containing protein [Crocosphaera watsonii]|uniref:PEP-CTERM protein-sorting domain-containing protein n=1 Tax=Crocosphaera watsonii WH 8502 TaxID=423474 RepID=T2IJL3_CROWT|nr:PEP-CTERM sorting domain-containing protein [Crocosphaera watsonii]CCQ52345.1 hypothetical protein CWATWH8502_2694 [Crocosphaera watsonii WH 8502]